MTEDYKEITRTLIDKSFPALKDKKILILKAHLPFFACSLWLPPFLRLIVLSKRTRNFSSPVVTGLIAHELCHQERYIEMGAFKYLTFAVKFLTSRKAQADEEKATDRLTIEKGYGKELYQLSAVTFKARKDKRINELYLSLDEIKSYSESLGRWH
jgi:hypothetical protein